MRIRNSFLAGTGTLSDFEWSPPNWPQGFLLQAGPAPEDFVTTVARVPAGATALQRAIALMRELSGRTDHGGAIQSNTEETYRLITTRGGGYCADYTQVFNGLAWTAGIAVREWGVSFDGFGGFGHAFNEVYEPDLRKWVMLDPFYGFLVRDRRSGEPLSAIEFRDRMRLEHPLDSLRVEVVVPRAYDFTADEKLVRFYQRGVDQFYLWWGNNVFDYDNESAVRLAGEIGRPVEQLAAVMTGVHPRIRILPSGSNSEMVEALLRTRDKVTALVAVSSVLLVLLIVQWLGMRRYPRGKG